MKPVAILYATRHGQTRTIADHFATTLRAHDVPAEVVDVAALPPDFSLDRCAGAILAASLHLGHHEREIVRFAKENRSALDALPTAFLSVSLSQAGAEAAWATAEQRAQGAADARERMEAFFAETGWHPLVGKPVAGALRYRQYGWFLRLVMRNLARRVGASTDTTHDHEFTDWQSLDRFATDFAEHLVAHREL